MNNYTHIYSPCSCNPLTKNDFHRYAIIKTVLYNRLDRMDTKAMSNGNNNTNPMNVWYSKPFDVHIWSDYKEINQVVDQIYDSFTEDEHLAITGRSNNQGRASGKVHLKVIILDLYVAWKTDPELCIGIELSNNAYKVGSRYNALHISVRVATVVPILFSNGWIDLNTVRQRQATGY